MKLCQTIHFPLFTGKEIKAEEGQCIADIVGRIPRRDVAKFMLECAISHDWNKKCVAIGLEP